MGEISTSGEREPSQPAKRVTAVLPFAGAAAVLVGGLIAYLNRDFVGWFAYAPLSNEPFSGSGMAFVTQGTQIGLAVAVVGLLVLAFWAGFRTGRKASPKKH
ncbi:hypothetical protein ACFVYC_04515 [Pseudarthrobacter sp. NPDC058329]|uniref:hypothetical protein n=1 Tax=Pseudarthrobacter sp. NPDC058329 TaxID=3346448 RepID=UPI0036DDE083